MAGGDLLPLVPSNNAVAAFIRRAGDRAVLVVANLGGTPLTRVTVSSPGAVLPAGRYRLGPTAEDLVVGSDGRIRQYVPVSLLEPRALLVFEITTRR